MNKKGVRTTAEKESYILASEEGSKHYNLAVFRL